MSVEDARLFFIDMQNMPHVDDLVDYFTTYNVIGTPGSSLDFPIVNVLRLWDPKGATYLMFGACVDTDAHDGLGSVLWWLTEPMKQFVRNFNAGMYPKLERVV